MPKAKPYSIHVSDDVLDDLRRWLTLTRWLNQPIGTGWSFGVPLVFIQELVDYWLNVYDWRAHEAEINAFPNFLLEVDGVGIHFLHIRSGNPAAVPLLIHGYPSSVVEYLAVADALVSPESLGGEAFDLVIPTIPGHGFSDMPGHTAFEDRSVASLFAALMNELGCDRSGIHAYDIGASIAGYRIHDYPDRIIGYHTTNPGNPRPAIGLGAAPLSPPEQEYLEHRQQWREREGAHSQLLAAKYQALAYGLHDSPAGLAAWIMDKWFAWTVAPAGRLEDHVSKDFLITTIIIYRVTQSTSSANRYYAEELEELGPVVRLEATTGVALPTNEPANCPPREYVERLHPNISHWVEVPSSPS